MNKVVLHVILDVNVIIDALQGQPMPVTRVELGHRLPILTEIVATEGAALVDSDHILNTFVTTAKRVLGYTTEEATSVANLLQHYSACSHGSYVTVEDSKEFGAIVEKDITPRFLGKGRGQIDHEDLQVLGAAYCNQSYGDDKEFTLIVTRDGGLFNVAHDIASKRVGVAHLHNALTAVRALARFS